MRFVWRCVSSRTCRQDRLGLCDTCATLFLFFFFSFFFYRIASLPFGVVAGVRSVRVPFGRSNGSKGEGWGLGLIPWRPGRGWIGVPCIHAHQRGASSWACSSGTHVEARINSWNAVTQNNGSGCDWKRKTRRNRKTQSHPWGTRTCRKRMEDTLHPWINRNTTDQGTNDTSVGSFGSTAEEDAKAPPRNEGGNLRQPMPPFLPPGRPKST